MFARTTKKPDRGPMSQLKHDMYRAMPKNLGEAGRMAIGTHKQVSKGVQS